MMKTFKTRFLALAMVAVMALPMAACGKDEPKTPSKTTPTAGVTTTPSGEATPTPTPFVDVPYEEWTIDYDKLAVNVGSVEAVKGSAGGGTLNYDVYAGVAGKDYTDEKVYTFNDYIAGTSNMKWSTHTWETNDDSYVLGYISSGFYDFQLNSTKDGWAIVCEMAAELPVDVTADYVGQFGIAAGDKAKAFKVTLNPNSKWEDGTPINADTFMYSYKELLDPVMLNRRADSLYAGDFEIAGAKAYFYQGTSAFTALGMAPSDFIAAGGDASTLYVDMSFWGVSAPDGSQYAAATDDTLVRDPAVADENDPEAYVSGKYLYETYLGPGCPYESYGAEYVGTLVSYPAGASFDSVGIIKTGEYELVFVSAKEVTQPEYYVPYNLSGTYLVYESMWENCKTYRDSNGNVVDASSADIASVTTNYCTTKDTTMSYGPYVLDYFELDKQITFKRNDNWYGYSDNKHKGQYQTDIISCQVIGEHATALLAFEKGEIDGISLTAADMEKYGASDYIRFTPQSYTTKLSFNVDPTKTTERGTQIMTNVNFRHAFALALDRTTFAQSYTSAGTAGYGLLNYMYVYDPYTGATYRDTNGGMEAIVKLNGLKWGEGEDYETLEEAYEAVTNYDMVAAKALMATAYDECVADGLYKEGDEVKIQLRVYSDDDIYVQMFNYIKGCLEEACKGSGFEGKVTMEMVVDADYYETNYSGGADMIFTTWGGAAYSPWTVLYQCYCDDAYGAGQQMEYGFDTSKIKVSMVINGKEYTQSLQTWAAWASGDSATEIKSNDGSETLDMFANYDTNTMASIFGKLEYAFLAFYTTTPVYYRNSGSLVSQKGDYAVSEYIDIIGFGGLQFYTYEYDDTEWETVRAQGLTY